MKLNYTVKHAHRRNKYDKINRLMLSDTVIVDFIFTAAAAAATSDCMKCQYRRMLER